MEYTKTGNLVALHVGQACVCSLSLLCRAIPLKMMQDKFAAKLHNNQLQNCAVKGLNPIFLYLPKRITPTRLAAYSMVRQNVSVTYVPHMLACRDHFSMRTRNLNTKLRTMPWMKLCLGCSHGRGGTSLCLLHAHARVIILL